MSKVEAIQTTQCYGVFADVRNYAMLQETALELIMQITEPVGLYGKPLADTWVPMEVTWFYNPDEEIRPQPDIAAFGSTAFAASASVCGQLMPYIQDYVEFLPIHVEGSTWFIIHVLAKENVFNAEQSRRYVLGDGSFGRSFEKLVLDGDRAAHGVLFRVDGLGLGIYSTDRPGSFMSVVRELGMTGMKFQTIK